MVALALGAALLAGCSTPPPATYDLTASPRPSGVGSIAQLAIAEPEAVALYDTERLVVRSSGNAVAYLPGAQWPDRLPKIFQARLVQTFENAGLVGRAGRPGNRVISANQLNTEIRTFEARADTREAMVEVSAKIVNDRTGQVFAAQIFTVRVPLGEIAGPAAAVSLDAANQQLLTQLVRWVAGRS
jgi:cholesterol transport system auxiliary component